MCERCHQYDDKITRYRRLASRINDRIAQDGIAELIETALATKAALHPEPEQK
ncbi:hypothetical protein IVB55_17990 [Bradyrhizobium sp. CW4]|uniref:hypothetical protein n=1 Tax=Bradyrhizobium sp. CW4 TaxID=2782687 RepID=UPI001FF7CCC4|nr:hypothetical protein [Bradyrhizobium sp. CW4]MCK1414831.1 hypothetical protein [Bradyrhizobium sp. CW4]